MLAQPSRLILINASVPIWNQRGMATLKMISLRLKSVKNIQKITQSMKMVSAAKYARAERELKLARPFGFGAQMFYEKAEVQKPEDPKANKIMLTISSDRGLCGAIHSSVSKVVKAELADGEEHTNIKIVTVGDKARGILGRVYGQNMLFSVKEIGRRVTSFEDASRIARELLDSGFEFEFGNIIFNKFRSVVSYKTTEIPIYSLKTITEAPKLSIYDSLDADVIQCYQEYSLACLIYYAIKENSCSEQSSRMTSMDNATKNAGEMIDKLSLTFNRTRQSVITRELIEIISGASALEAKD